MEKKSESISKKKRGRPRKIRVKEEEEVFEISGSNYGDSENTILPRRKRNGRASLPGCVSPPSASLGNPATLALVKQILKIENKSYPNNHLSPVEFTLEPPIPALGLDSLQERTCSDKVVEEQSSGPSSREKANGSVPSKNILNLKRFTTDLLSQKSKMPPSDELIMLDEHLLEKELNMDSNDVLNGHEETPNRNSQPQGESVTRDDNSSKLQPERKIVNVEGYKVKKEWQPLLKSIFSKYGDIAKNSSFTKESRSCLLELVCSIYKRLESLKFTHLTPLELQSMQGQIGDLELVKVEIGWLQKRLDQISTARKLYEGVSTLEDVEKRTLLVVDEKKKRVETCMATMNELRRSLDREKDELAATVDVAHQIKLFFNDSFVHGLV